MASAPKKRTAFKPDPRFDATRYEIPFIHEQNRWSPGETYQVRVSNVLDPSKFWIVDMDKKLGIFQTSMMNFYLENWKQYKFQRAFVKKNTYCVTWVNGAYFRAIILNKSFGTERKVPVFLIDFGVHRAVEPSDLFHFHESYYEVPRFGMRARLSTIKPYEGYSWTNHCIKEFDDLVTEKILTITIGHIDPVEKVIYISPQMNPSAKGSFADIAKALIDRQLAEKEDVDVSNIAVCRIPHFLPTFYIIENGTSVLKQRGKENRNPSTGVMVKVSLTKKKD